MAFSLRDAAPVDGVDTKRMRRLPERGRVGEVNVSFPEQTVPFVIVSAEYQAYAAVGHEGRFETAGLPVGMGITASTLGRDEVVLEVNLRRSVTVVHRGDKAFTLCPHTLGNVGVHFIVEKQQNAVAGNVKIRGKVAVDTVEGLRVVVVAVEKGDGAGQRREAFADQAEVSFAEGDELRVVHPVKRVVDQVARNDDEIRGFPANAVHRPRYQIRHVPAQAPGNGGGAGKMTAEMKVRNVGDLHSVVPIAGVIRNS